MPILELIDNPSLFKPFAATVMLAVLWCAESVAPMYVGRSGRVPHGLRNLALGLVNTLLVALPFAGLMWAVTGWAQGHGLGLYALLPGPAWLGWVLVLVLLDAWMYLWHRLNHRVPLLWRFHAVHHSDREMDASSAFRFHTGEIALSFVARLAVLPLLGMSMPQLLLYESVLLPVILFHHSNIRLPAGIDRVLRLVIVTPRMHWVHHSRIRVETDSNYASVLSVWDRVFGSFRLRKDPEQIALGLEDDEGGRAWKTLGGMLGSPLTMGRRSRPDEAQAKPREVNRK